MLLLLLQRAIRRILHPAPPDRTGSANTAMTLEFATAGGANSYESVTITGYDAL